MPVHLEHMLLHLQGYDSTICYHPGKEMVLPNTLSWFSPHPGPDIPLDIAIHHAHLSPDRKEAFQQAFVSDPKMCALANMIITGWPKDINVVPHLLCPYWQHQETLTIENGLVICGEALIVPPLEWERILQQLHQFHQETTKAQLFMHMDVSSGQDINKAIEEAVLAVWDLHQVPGPKYCSTSHSNANSALPMADVHHRYLLLRRNWLPDMWWLVFKDNPHLISSIWPEQHCQSHLTAQRDVLRAWNFWSTLLQQQPSVCKCTIHWVLHLLGYHTARPQALTTHN